MCPPCHRAAASMAERLRRRLEGRDDAGYYAALGAFARDSQASLRKRYFALAKALHPDRGQEQDPETLAQIARIGEAWSVLKSARLRQVYDLEGKAGLDELSDVASGGSENEDEMETVDAPGVAAFKDFTTVVSSSSSSSSISSSSISSSAAPRSNQAASLIGEVAPSRVPTTVDPVLTLQIAEAVAEAIRRTEEKAAEQYERALAMLLGSLDTSLSAAEGDRKARDAWLAAKAPVEIDL